MRGDQIKANRFHDAGAYAQCGKCNRYTDDMSILSREIVKRCSCGETNYWSCSFKKPTEKSIWQD